MLAFAGISSAQSLVVTYMIAGKLYSLSRRTGGMPERLLARALGFTYCVGFPLASLIRLPALSGTHQGNLIFTIGMGFCVVGTAHFARFPQVVFRPGQRGAQILSALVSGVALLGGVACVVAAVTSASSEETIRTSQAGALGLVGALLVIQLWNAFDATNYYRRLRKRLALGLADPVAAHRILLWALTNAFGAIPSIGIIAIRSSGQPIISPLPLALIAASSTFMAIALWLGFFMPEAYRARLEARAPTVNA